jgi:hypothetical protein
MATKQGRHSASMTKALAKMRHAKATWNAKEKQEAAEAQAQASLFASLRPPREMGTPTATVLQALPPLYLLLCVPICLDTE